MWSVFTWEGGACDGITRGSVVCGLCLLGRAEHVMELLGDQLIVCGGHTLLDSPRCLNSVEVYSLELEQWTYITPMRKDCACMGAAGNYPTL